jgi:hypothetical protein
MERVWIRRGRHPRRSRLGLIEAGAWALLAGVPCRIRGIRASASLKLDGFHVAVTVQGRHPRRSRLGLIEARGCCGRRRCRCSRIRGVRASASLKLRVRVLPRGRSAGVSNSHSSGNCSVEGVKIGDEF